MLEKLLLKERIDRNLALQACPVQAVTRQAPNSSAVQGVRPRLHVRGDYPALQAILDEGGQGFNVLWLIV